MLLEYWNRPSDTQFSAKAILQPYMRWLAAILLTGDLRTVRGADHIRIEACDTCKRYIKGVDLTRLGFAIPLVDEVAAAALDIWSHEHWYTKIELNLMGL